MNQPDHTDNTSRQPTAGSRSPRHGHKKRRRRPKVTIQWGRLSLSLAILAAAILLLCQTVSTCRSCTSAPASDHPMTTSAAIDSAAAIARAHAAEYTALSPDTSAMCDYLLEVQARATNFRHRFGDDAADTYLNTFGTLTGLQPR